MKIIQLKLQNTLFPLEKGVRGLFSTSLILQNNKNIYPDRRILFVFIESKANVLDGYGILLNDCSLQIIEYNE